MGETDDEVYATMDDLRGSDVDFLTIGQYLKPQDKNQRYTGYGYILYDIYF